LLLFHGNSSGLPEVIYHRTTARESNMMASCFPLVFKLSTVPDDLAPVEARPGNNYQHCYRMFKLPVVKLNPVNLGRILNPVRKGMYPGS
jgi:hypothetical protein